MFANRLKKTADNLISKYGNTGSLRIVTVGSYNPITGETTNIEMVIPTKYTLRRYSLNEIETGLVGINDVEIMFVTDETVNELCRFVLNDGRSVNLTNITKIEAQDTTVIYKAQGVANA